MENFEKMTIMCKKQEISRQAAPTIFGNELRSKSIICIGQKSQEPTAFSINSNINN
ncbi:MAG TPA: hypothetical protein P5538_06115 [Bacteroidales bacterium]|jgi:hypothetical protein|nr:hypothetical protein [Bacteroidales bacterium]HOM36574.1 hypothetical protein [Bacteroidales bacterium]HRS99800.1 hypothetical protein [Bacteroidales bacterium]HRT80499.1 hypothetical protein [Bacteroidales bacterium]HUM32758.1 hypothetical protein [Bacteroidales bacterium]